MTLYLLKVHLQTFLSITITQKCEILSFDTLVANERYVFRLSSASLTTRKLTNTSSYFTQYLDIQWGNSFGTESTNCYNYVGMEQPKVKHKTENEILFIYIFVSLHNAHRNDQLQSQHEYNNARRLT
jgi:hypothetical protein